MFSLQLSETLKRKEVKQAKAIDRVKVHFTFFIFLPWGTRLIFFRLLQAKYEWDLESMVTQHKIERQNETKQVRRPNTYYNPNPYPNPSPNPNPNLNPILDAILC